MRAAVGLFFVASTAGALAAVWLAGSTISHAEGPSQGVATRLVSEFDLGEARRSAEQSVERIQLFQTGNGGERLTLDGRQVTDLMRHSAPGLLPQGVLEPEVSLVGDEVHLTAVLVPAEFPASSALRAVSSVVADTVSVKLRGTLVRVSSSTLGLRIDSAVLGHLTLPVGVVRSVAESLSGQAGSVDAASGSRREATFRVAWPSGVDGIGVRDGLLVLERFEPILERAVDGSGG